MHKDPETSLGAGAELAKLNDLFTGSIQGMDDESNCREFKSNGESEATE